jgi:hypothetical protein
VLGSLPSLFVFLCWKAVKMKNPFDLDLTIEELYSATQVASTVLQMQEQLSHYQPLRSNFASSAAIQTAMEHLLGSVQAKLPTQRFVAQENFIGYPTQDQLYSIAQENFSSMKEAFLRVMARIGEVFKTLIIQFGQVFERKQWIYLGMQKHAAWVDQRLALIKSNHEETRTEPIYNDRINRMLSINGYLPDPNSVTRAADLHMQQMRKLHQTLDQISTVLFGCVQKGIYALGRQVQSVDELIAVIKPGLDALYRHPLGQHRGRSEENGKQWFTFEEPLIFGNKAYWSLIEDKDGEDPLSANSKRVHAEFVIRDSSRSVNDFSGQAIEPLRLEQIRHINRLCGQHGQEMARLNTKHKKMTAEFSRLGKLADDWMNTAKTAAFDLRDTSGMGRLYRPCISLWFLASVASSVFNRAVSRLDSYDREVISSLQHYLDASLSPTSHTAPAGQAAAA